MTIVTKAVELLKHKPQIILQGPPGTGKTHTARDIGYEMIFDKKVSTKAAIREQQLDELEQSDQFRIVQFHPAYTYEDFVRGIRVRNNGSAIEYVTENKVMAEFAAIAHQNYIDTIISNEEFSKRKWFNELFPLYVEMIEEKLRKKKGEEKKRYVLREDSNCYIFGVQEKVFEYYCSEFRSTGTGFRLSFTELEKRYFATDWEKEFTAHKIPEGQTKYYRSNVEACILLNLKVWLDEQEPYTLEDNPLLKKYVLVIDEINRANLSTVLGELIYALEYRGKKVESMYDIDGDRSLVLPKNLYIIGTMNTADRSVGHIDYAIRRRFSFLDILPEESHITEPKAKSLFEQVATLFNDSTYLAPDFNSKEVQIGHSYFFSNKNKFDLSQALEYEIRPILNQYVKDGILLEPAKQEIENLHV